MSEWPKSGPDFNRWNLDAARFAKLVQDHPRLWLMDGRLKYLEVRIDTRDGGFVVKDRDGNLIEPERVMRAAERSRERFGDAGRPSGDTAGTGGALSGAEICSGDEPG